MPLFEVETENHIVITWAEDGDAASAVVGDAYPQEHVMRLTKRPRDTWVISKSALGIAGNLRSGRRHLVQPPAGQAVDTTMHTALASRQGQLAFAHVLGPARVGAVGHGVRQAFSAIEFRCA